MTRVTTVFDLPARAEPRSGLLPQCPLRLCACAAPYPARAGRAKTVKALRRRIYGKFNAGERGIRQRYFKRWEYRDGPNPAL
jgi:hypothetical protein